VFCFAQTRPSPIRYERAFAGGRGGGMFTSANHTVIQSEGGRMADDLNEFDDPEQSYRRGYVHGAREVLAAIEQRLSADQRGMVETWLEGDLSKWRLENLRGKTGRNKTGLTGNMGPPRLLILD
jgi:hypothetical protein